MEPTIEQSGVQEITPTDPVPSRIDGGVVPKTQFYGVYNRWRAAHFIRIINTKSRID